MFRKTLDGEMKDATKCGVAQASKMSEKEEITEREETILWDMALLGANTAESLLYTVYFYNGKLFGLRAGEHRLIRLSNIVVEGNKIVFDEFRGKTFKGGLKDLKNKPRYIEHICHENREIHSPCLASMYSVYIEKIRSHAESIDSFYFRPHRGGKFEYEKSPVGLCTLNKILPEKLLGKAGLPRKTAHCLRVTCATRLFQNSVEEKLARERTGHRSNALFGYQKASDEQVQNVSKLLAPVNDSRKSGQSEATEKCKESETNTQVLEDLPDSDFDLSDDILASIPMPESTISYNENNICTNSVFNNCTINFVVKK